MKLLALLLALVVALGTAIWLDDTPPRADLVYVNVSEVFTLDPQRMTWMQDLRMAYCLYEGLARWDNDDFTVERAAAEWTISDDRLSYTFTLRPDARWSNGDPVTAHDFVYSWRRAILPDTAAQYSSLFMLIDGAESFFRWRTQALADFSRRADGLDTATRRDQARVLWDETERMFATTVGLTATDDHTLRVTLARPTPYFLDLVAFGVFCPVHRPTVEGWTVDPATAARIRESGWADVGPPPWPDRSFVSLDPDTGRLRQQHVWTKPGRLVGNGPYVLTDWRYKRGLYIKRNPLYHTPDLIRSETIACVSIEDVNTAVLAFESGRIDWLTDVSVEYQGDLLAQRTAYEARHASEIEAGLSAGRTLDETLAGLPAPTHGQRRNIHMFPTFGTDFYSFNCRPTLGDGRSNPFADAAVRRAFVLSVDKALIVRSVTRLDEPVATSLVPPGSIPGYTPPVGLAYDADGARQQLASAGWTDSDGDGLVEDGNGELFPVVDLLYSTNGTRYRNISLALRDMWQRELGVRVELRGKESKFFREDLRQGNFMIGRGGWYGDYGDPTTFLDLCRTGDGNNVRGYSSQRVDDLLNRAAEEGDPRARFELLQACERLLVTEEVPMLVLCQYVQMYMYEPGRLTGLSRHPRLTQYLWKMKAGG